MIVEEKGVKMSNKVLTVKLGVGVTFFGQSSRLVKKVSSPLGDDLLTGLLNSSSGRIGGGIYR